MGIELYWDDDARTVMLMEVRDQWTWDELTETLNKVKRVTDTAGYEIGAILDLGPSLRIPGGTIFTPGALTYARKVLQMSEGGSGPVVVVGGGPVIKTIAGAVKALDAGAVSKVRFADTVDAARALLNADMAHQLA